MNRSPRLLRILPKFSVRDVGQSFAYDRDMLGFRVSSSLGDPPVFGIVERDGCGIHLKRGEPRVRKTEEEAWDAYFEIVGVDEVLAEYRARGAHIARGPEVMSYGYKEIDVLDPDGYVLCFAEDIGAP